MVWAPLLRKLFIRVLIFFEEQDHNYLQCSLLSKIIESYPFKQLQESKNQLLRAHIERYIDNQPLNFWPYHLLGIIKFINEHINNPLKVNPTW